MAVRSFTVLPLVVPPKRKLYLPLLKLSLGLSLERKSLLNGFIQTTSSKMGMKKAPILQ